MKLRTSLYVATALFAGMATAPAHAQLGLCPSPVMPPPCIVFDYKRLADMATKHAQEVRKIQEQVKQITQINLNIQTIGQDLLRELQVPQIPTLPGADVDQPDGGITANARRFSGLVFAGPEASADRTNEVREEREEQLRIASADAFAYSQQGGRILACAERQINNLRHAATISPDLRGDWNVNSQVRQEMIRQVAQKNHLWSVYLQLASAELANRADIRSEAEYNPSAPSALGEAAIVDPTRARTTELNSIKRDLMRLLGNYAAVEGSRKAIEMLRGVIGDHKNAETRAETNRNTLTSRIAAIVGNRANAGAITNQIVGQLTNMDAQFAQMREQPVESLAQAFAQRRLDVAQLTQANVDARQFLGTWADPAKVTNTTAMVNGLFEGSLGNVIRDGDDRRRVLQAVIDYNDARLEEAWKRPTAEEAQQNIDSTQSYINGLLEETRAAQGSNEVTAQIQQLVARANELGQQINTSSDTGAKTIARQTIEEIQKLVNPPSENTAEPEATPTNAGPGATRTTVPQAIPATPPTTTPATTPSVDRTPTRPVQRTQQDVPVREE